MNIIHIALGGCMKAPPVKYGITEDTGGHIAYVLGGAIAQSQRSDVESVKIVTRYFDEPNLDDIHSNDIEVISEKCQIVRIKDGNSQYLSKEALVDRIPDIATAFIQYLRAKNVKPDIIHAHFSDAAILAQAANLALGVPWIYTPHSLGKQKSGHVTELPTFKRRIYREQFAISNASAIVVSSRHEAECQLTPYAHQSQGWTHRINPGVQSNQHSDVTFAKRLITPFLANVEKPIILAIARPVKKKNLLKLLITYAESPSLQEKANLVLIAGLHQHAVQSDREQREVIKTLADTIKFYKLEGKVAFPESHQSADIESLYTLASQNGVFVNPAFIEPFGLTLIEAAHAGVPIVATNQGGPVDIIEELGFGVLVDPDSSHELETGIHKQLNASPPETYRTNAKSLFNWNNWADKSLILYNSLIQPHYIECDETLLKQLFITDIDGTLTGCRQSASIFSDWLNNKTKSLGYMIATGRSIIEARRVLADWQIPEPPTLITSVGTEIWRQTGFGKLTLCKLYANHIDTDWHRDHLVDLLNTLDVNWQNQSEQRQWKLSLFGDNQLAIVIQQLIIDNDMKAKVIASHNRYIDIVPQRAGKSGALSFEANRLNIPLAHCVTAGDSGNDLDMLACSGKAIVPANAYDELSACTGFHVYRSQQSYAAGVLDGLKQLGLNQYYEYA